MNAFDRDKARGVLIDFGKLWDYHGARDEQEALDALEACVVPDPRITRIEAVLRDYAGMSHMIADNVRAIMRGDE